MPKKCLLLMVLAIFFSLLLNACGVTDNPKGACVNGSGISARCGDYFTSGQCDMVNGTFNEDRTCKQLGF